MDKLLQALFNMGSSSADSRDLEKGDLEKDSSGNHHARTDSDISSTLVLQPSNTTPGPCRSTAWHPWAKEKQTLDPARETKHRKRKLECAGEHENLTDMAS